MKSKIFGYIFGTARPAAGGGACRAQLAAPRRLVSLLALGGDRRGAGGRRGPPRAPRQSAERHVADIDRNILLRFIASRRD